MHTAPVYSWAIWYSPGYNLKEFSNTSQICSRNIIWMHTAPGAYFRKTYSQGSARIAHCARCPVRKQCKNRVFDKGYIAINSLLTLSVSWKITVVLTIIKCVSKMYDWIKHTLHALLCLPGLTDFADRLSEFKWAQKQTFKQTKSKIHDCLSLFMRREFGNWQWSVPDRHSECLPYYFFSGLKKDRISTSYDVKITFHRPYLRGHNWVHFAHRP